MDHNVGFLIQTKQMIIQLAVFTQILPISRTKKNHVRPQQLLTANMARDAFLASVSPFILLHIISVVSNGFKTNINLCQLYSQDTRQTMHMTEVFFVAASSHELQRTTKRVFIHSTERITKCISSQPVSKLA